MAKKQLKKRIFVPTGNDLGEFTIFDLQPVDITFVDSDDNSQQGSSGDSKMGGSSSSIPDPVDNNPLSKVNNSSSSQGSSGGKDANPYASNSGDSTSNDEFSKQERDLDNDLYGEDLDTDREEKNNSNNNNSDGDGGSSGDSGSGESGGSSGGMMSDDNSYAPPNYDGSSNMGDDSSSMDTTSEMEDALNKEQENMSDTAKERVSEVSGESSQSSNEDSSKQQSGDKSQGGVKSQSGDNQSSQSSDSQNGNNSQSGDTSQSGDSSNSWGSDGSQSQDNQAGSGSRGDKAGKGNKPNDDFKKAHDTKGNDLDDTDGKGVVDKIVREAAKRMQEELDKDETLANTNQQSLDNYKDFGAGTMTTLFKGNSMVADWKAKLEKLFRKALGQRITMNPNMINKRIEDAPPGREDIETQMVKVAVLIDCSGSMGSGAFKKVIMQMDAMIKADKQMRNVLFYIIPFEAWSANDCIKRMVKCKGTKLKAELMKFKAEGGTNIVPGFQALMKKVKNPDSIIVLSDCVVNASSTVSDPTYQKWLKKYRDRIIWVLTSKRDISYMSAIDSYAKKQDRYVVFKGNGD